jgi:hypothetical protein
VSSSDNDILSRVTDDLCAAGRSPQGRFAVRAMAQPPMATAVERAAARSSGLTARGFLVWFFVTLIASFGFAWLYVAAMPMAFLDRDYPLWIAKRTMLDECHLGAVSVFGDSRTMAATIPSVMTMPVENFAMSGTSPIETYFAVERAMRCRIMPKLVVIAHGALKFSSDPGYWVFSARSGFLNYAEMRAIDADAARLNDNELIDMQRGDGLRPALRELLFALRFPPFYFDSLVNGYVALRWQHNREAMRDALRSSGHALFGTAAGSSGLAIEAGSEPYSTSPLVDLFFSRTLALLAKHGVQVMVLTMPINHATFVRTRPELGRQFDAYLRTKTRQYPNLRVVGPTIPCWPDRFYGDAWHFNARGAEAYSRELDPVLRSVLVNSTPRPLPNHCTVNG